MQSGISMEIHVILSRAVKERHFEPDSPIVHQLIFFMKHGVFNSLNFRAEQYEVHVFNSIKRKIAEKLYYTMQLPIPL